MEEKPEKFPEDKQNNDNVISLEKKPEEKAKRPTTFEEEFKKQFFQTVEDPSQAIPLKKGLEIKEKRELVPKKEKLSQELKDFKFVIDMLEKDLLLSKEAGDEEAIENLSESLERSRRGRAEKEKELSEIRIKMDELEMRANNLEQRRIYGE